jgi:hypothetical protein
MTLPIMARKTDLASAVRTMDLETILEDSRVRVVGAVVGGFILICSFGFFAASRMDSHRLDDKKAYLPEQPLRIPIMRQLPNPQPMKVRTTRMATAQR